MALTRLSLNWGISPEVRRELIRQQIKETPEKSDRQIADGLGVNHSTVGTQRKELEAGGEISHLKESIGADGKQYPRRPVTVYNPTRREREYRQFWQHPARAGNLHEASFPYRQ